MACLRNVADSISNTKANVQGTSLYLVFIIQYCMRLRNNSVSAQLV